MPDGGIQIVYRNDAPFTDREEAGVLLGNELKHHVGKSVVVLGIPRGGLAIARAVARVLEADLDIVLSRKLGAPENPELAIGAVAEDGQLFLHRHLITELGISPDYIEQERARQVAEISRRTRLIRQFYPKVPLRKRETLVTDDGAATGATMQAALWAVRQENPGRLVCGLPVGPEETLEELARDADELVCLKVPHVFQAVGQFYDTFPQLEDTDVLNILRNELTRKGAKH